MRVTISYTQATIYHLRLLNGSGLTSNAVDFTLGHNIRYTDIYTI